jgi:hypothetical protein
MGTPQHFVMLKRGWGVSPLATNVTYQLFIHKHPLLVRLHFLKALASSEFQFS